MKEQIIQKVMSMMMPILDNEQAQKLLDTLNESLQGVNLVAANAHEVVKTEVDYIEVNPQSRT